jgi:hypothetical protein
VYNSTPSTRLCLASSTSKIYEITKAILFRIIYEMNLYTKYYKFQYQNMVKPGLIRVHPEREKFCIVLSVFSDQLGFVLNAFC